MEPPIGDRLPLGLLDALEAVWEDFLPGGWEINGGSYGTLTLDVARGDVITEIEYGDDDEDEELDEEEME